MINDYLNRFKICNEITLVGPLLIDSFVQEDPIVFVDGAVHFKTSSHIGYSIGDGDSSTFKLDQKLNPHKDLSDLAFVLKDLPSNFKNIKLKGFLGGRKDHELMNLAEVHQFLKNRTQTSVSFDNLIIAKSLGKWSINYKGIFSLFCFSETLLSLQGDCLYSLNTNRLRPASSHGLSNVSKGTIELKNDNPLFIFLNT